MSASLQLALFSCLLLGLRHGFDYDHLAAITDITSTQRNWRGSMRLGLLYALGHALTVAALGVPVIFLHISLPASLDRVGERIVGATLIVLAIYVSFSLWRSRNLLRKAGHTHKHLSRSRIAMLVSGTRVGVWHVRRLFDRNAKRPDTFAFRYDRGSVFVVGILHGLGAETPSQLLLFLLAANLGGPSRGLLGLLCFLAGLLTMNSLMTAGASGIFLSSKHRPRVDFTVTSLTVAYSFAVGAIFLFGLSDKLPPLVR